MLKKAIPFYKATCRDPAHARHHEGMQGHGAAQEGHESVHIQGRNERTKVHGDDEKVGRIPTRLAAVQGREMITTIEAVEALEVRSKSYTHSKP